MTDARALPRHFTCIDAMRGIAAIFVVIFHSTRFFMEDAQTFGVAADVHNMPYGSVLWPAYIYGEEAVRLFWVISGFVFAHVYWNRPTDCREFVVARFARLYPLHFVTLLIVAGLQMVSLQTQGYWQITGNNDLKHFLLQLTLMDTGLSLSDGTSFNAPIWSVSAEVFVYAIFFVTLSFTRARPFTGCLAMSVMSFAILTVRPDGFLIGPYVFACGVFFFAGGAVYAAHRRLTAQARTSLGWAAMLLAFGVAGAAMGQYDLALLTLCCGVVLTLAAMEPAFGGPKPVLQFLGDISYSLYLVHMPVMIATLLLVDLVFGGGRGFAQSYATLPLFLIGSIWIAYLTNRYFEKPVGAWLRRRLMRRDRDVAGTASAAT